MGGMEPFGDIMGTSAGPKRKKKKKIHQSRSREGTGPIVRQHYTEVPPLCRKQRKMKKIPSHCFSTIPQAAVRRKSYAVENYTGYVIVFKKFYKQHKLLTLLYTI